MTGRNAQFDGSPRATRWLALVACVLVVGQALVSAHAADVADHSGDRYCEVCLFASNAAGAAPAAPAAPMVAPPRGLLRGPRAQAVASVGYWPTPLSRAPPVKPTDR